MHLETLYVTCLCVTPVSRSTGLIYKPDKKERRVATNARHAANGIEWPRGEQKGYWGMESCWRQHRGTRIHQQQHLLFHIQHPGSASGGAFCETMGHTVPTVQTIPPWITTQLPGTGRSWHPPQGLFFSFCLWSPRAGSRTCTLFPVASVDVETVLLHFLSAQGETQGGVFSLLHSLQVLKCFFLVIASSKDQPLPVGLREGRERAN